MGPLRHAGELLSSYRMRYAAYCTRWALFLLLPFIGLLAFRPTLSAVIPPFPLMFFTIGLPLGGATATVAAIGFFIGSIWARLLERSPRLAALWPRAKVLLRLVVLFPVSLFGFFAFGRGVIEQSVLVPSRGPALPKYSLAEEPLAYFLALLFWGAITIALLYYQFKQLRKAFAT
jgi:hypothetical protein